jgi:hypothetical protein
MTAVKPVKCCDTAAIRAIGYYKQGILLSNIQMNELKKTMKKFSQGNQYPTSDMNLRSIRYEI